MNGNGPGSAGLGAPQGGGARILLVDDDDFVRRYAEEALVQLGYRVVAAASGPQALEALESNSDIELLFTDIVMPGGMNGRELVTAARRIHPGIRVLYTSGFMSSEIVRLTRLDPEARLLEKPYRRSQLAQAVRDSLDAGLAAGVPGAQRHS